eukprot:scaffold51304_cov59-Attheya_sp.AAC.1
MGGTTTAPVPDVTESSSTVTMSAKDKDDYKNLQKCYLEERVRRGKDAELPSGGMRLRRQVRPARIDAPQYKKLKRKLIQLKRMKNHAERYRLFSLLSHYEMKGFGSLPSDLCPCEHEVETNDDDKVIEIVELDQSDSENENDGANFIDLVNVQEGQGNELHRNQNEAPIKQEEQQENSTTCMDDTMDTNTKKIYGKRVLCTEHNTLDKKRRMIEYARKRRAKAGSGYESGGTDQEGRIVCHTDTWNVSQDDSLCDSDQVDSIIESPLICHDGFPDTFCSQLCCTDVAVLDLSEPMEVMQKEDIKTGSDEFDGLEVNQSLPECKNKACSIPIDDNDQVLFTLKEEIEAAMLLAGLSRQDKCKINKKLTARSQSNESSHTPNANGPTSGPMPAFTKEPSKIACHHNSNYPPSQELERKNIENQMVPHYLAPNAPYTAPFSDRLILPTARYNVKGGTMTIKHLWSGMLPHVKKQPHARLTTHSMERLLECGYTIAKKEFILTVTGFIISLEIVVANALNGFIEFPLKLQGR